MTLYPNCAENQDKHLIRAIAMLDRKVYHPEIYEELKNE